MQARKWTYAAAIAALTVIALVRVASTHRVFSATHDEPAHLSAGYEWFTGSYAVDPSHPPLARILCAFPLWLRSDGAPQPFEKTDVIGRANELLYRGRYEGNLARARCGTLLLFAVAILGVAAWTRRTFSDAVAIAATALFTTVPAILGHAGVATTDLAVVAALPWALVALERYLEQPSYGRGALLGLALAFGLLAKFSFLVYFPLAALIGVAVEHPDYLAWFNELARPEPSNIVVDSNLEWGQDGLGLARAVRELRIDHLKLAYATNLRLAEHQVNAERLEGGERPQPL